MAFLNAFGAIGRFLVLGAMAVGAVGVVATGGTRGVFLVVALSVGITGLAFVLVGSRIGRVSGLDARLRTLGVAGRATVTSIGSTGVTVNGAPVVELTLDVDVSAHPPYSTVIRQRVPSFWGPLPPGSIVGVVVDPTDQEHLAVDWDAPAPGPAQQDPVVSAAGPAVDVEHLLQVGRSAKAIIISMSDAGDMSELGLVEVGRPGDDDRLFIVDMEVQEAGLEPYEVRVAHRVPERLVGRVGPRTRVRVAIDREDDHAVAIDWSSVGR